MATVRAHAAAPAAADRRHAEAGPGNHRADREGAARQEGRAHHQPRRAAGPFSGLHADARSHRRFAQDRFRGRALAPAPSGERREGHRGRRLHRSHRGRQRRTGRSSRRRGIPHAHVVGNQGALRAAQGALASASRPESGGAHSARLHQQRLLGHLGGFRGGVHEGRGLHEPLSAGAREPREALHEGDAGLRGIRHPAGNRQGPASESVAEIGRLHRHQPHRSAGGDRRQHRQVRGQRLEPPGRHDRQARTWKR